ncbi:fungal-specific transcription factor domain-containing protein [Mucidula mucida]|nr:fungal-specific transcription factor domain-containing protein [Mucidula mucida]
MATSLGGHIQHGASSSGQQSVPSTSYADLSGANGPRFLACLRCRAKKAKCDNVQPICGTCSKVSAECVRPSGRRRKRTRKEMEEAEKDNQFKRPRGLEDFDVPQQMAYPHPFAPLHYSQTSVPPLNGVLVNAKYEDTQTRSAKSSPTGIRAAPSPPKNVDPAQMVEALSRQMAYLEGDPGQSNILKVHYYRFSGRTAIHPGFNRIVIKLRSSTAASPASSPGSRINGTDACSEPDLEDISNLPPDYSLIDTFFFYFGQHFPFLRRKKIEERIQSETMSAFLLLAMNALAVRFAPHSKRKASQYISAAWTLVPPLLRLPSVDVVGGLLLLSWAEFGENSESGLWNFAGLAIRMALDLGLHTGELDSETSDDEVCEGKLLFWCLFLHDRVLAFGTGRSVTIAEDLIELPLPTDSDLADSSSASPNLLAPFVQVIRLFALAGRIADIMNGSRGCPRTLVTKPVVHSPETLQSLENQLVAFLEQLPAELHWSVENFRVQSTVHQGGIFLFLHLWANAVLALIHHPNLGRNNSGTDTPLSASVNRIILRCPFVNQCLFIAGVAFVHDVQSEDLGVHSNFIAGLVKQNLSAVLKALKRMELYWSGLGYIISVLEQRASGRGWSKVDFSITSDKTPNFISLPDAGILRRLTGVKAPPSDSSNSPREGLGMADGAPPLQLLAPPESTNFSFESLLSSYQVEEVTASATGFDFSNVFPEGFAW